VAGEGSGTGTGSGTAARFARGASAGTKIACSALAGAIAAVAVVLAGQAKYAPAVGWDVAAMTLLTWTWLVIWPMGPHETKTHATREDPSRPLGDVLVLAAAVASLSAVVFFLVQANDEKGATQSMLAAVAVVTIAFSWLLIHTIYALRYAQLYYTGADGGVDFNESTPPRYIDFAYLAFTVGMTFQVSDTDLKKLVVRATVLRHALLSFVFGSLILATTVNLVAGLGK
jgi:uncharacterized membrane protein